MYVGKYVKFHYQITLKFNSSSGVNMVIIKHKCLEFPKIFTCLTQEPVEPHRLSLLPKIVWHCDRQETEAAGWILPPKTLSVRSKVILIQTNTKSNKTH